MRMNSVPANGTGWRFKARTALRRPSPWILVIGWAALSAAAWGQSATEFPITAPGTVGASSGCDPDQAYNLCLQNGRFAVTAAFMKTPSGPSARALPRPQTEDTGDFYFFDPGNIELVVKVLDGCSVNGFYWVFVAGLTNLGVDLNVTDTRTGVPKTYSSPVGTPFQPIQDTSAFACP